MVNHARASNNRLLEIGRAARTLTQAGQEQLKQSYKKLIVLTRRVSAQAAAVLEDLKDGQLVARAEAFMKGDAAEGSLKHYLPLVEKIITQSQARIMEAHTRQPEKILNSFTAHSAGNRESQAHQ